VVICWLGQEQAHSQPIRRHYGRKTHATLHAFCFNTCQLILPPPPPTVNVCLRLFKYSRFACTPPLSLARGSYLPHYVETHTHTGTQTHIYTYTLAGFPRTGGGVSQASDTRTKIIYHVSPTRSLARHLSCALQVGSESTNPLPQHDRPKTSGDRASKVDCLLSFSS